MRSKLTSRMLAALLTVVMVVGLLPISALAARIDRDDAPVAEVAIGEETVEAPLRATPKAAEVAETEETVTVAKAELGTSAAFGGDQVALSNALYTFAASGTGYTISATVPGTETTVYLNIAGGTSTLPNMTSANGTPVGLTEQTASNSNKWFELRDGSSLHFHRGANELYFNRCTTVSASDMPNHYFALFRAAAEDDTSSGDIPGYVQLTALNEVTAGEKYLIAAKVSDNWYVLYPTTGSDKYNHVAKVVLVEEVVETPDEPETPVEKPRHYFESLDGVAWKIGDGTGLTSALTTPSGANVTEINGNVECRAWANGGFLKFDLVDGVLLASKKAGGQFAEAIHVEKQENGTCIISRVSSGATYYLTAENQDFDGQTHAVFSPNEADAVPYFVEATAAGANSYRIYCVGPYTVSFTGEGAEDIAPISAMYGTTLPTPADREGYTFVGWFDGETKYTEATADVALTAQWEAEPEPEVPGKEAPPTALETVIEYRLAEGTLAEGVYAIVGSTAEAGQTPRSMHYWTDTKTALDQCASGVPAGAETVSFSDVATNHLWNVTRTAEGKYTFAAVAAEGNYITGGAGTLSRGTTATEFTVVARSDGGHDLSWVSDGTTYYMAWDGTRASGSRWYGATDQYRINLYKEGNAPFAMAQTVFKGTSQNQPLVREDTNSQFRIPALYTLSNGWIVAASDIRWTTTADSPANLDTIVSVSKDGGETWDWEVVNYFADFPSTVNSSASASFIDPAIVQTKDGSVWLLVDAQAPHVNGGKIGNGFDGEGRLQISKSPVNGNYVMDNAHDNNLHGYTFDYYVDINNADAGADYTVDGETVKLWPICANADDHETGYYVDAFFNTYYDYDEGGMQAVLTLQRNSTKIIHSNIFYTESEWKVFPTAFIMARKATVNEEAGTLDWGEPRLISDQIKYNTEHFIGVCPGRGFVTEAGENGERIIFPIYDNLTGEKASSVYSDDGGATWHRGERIPNGQAGKSSESQIVELPVSENEADGTFLRIFCRNTNTTISYADSYDGGVTWSAGKLDSALKYGDNTMVSFINLKGYLIGADDTIYTNLILASYPWGTKESGEHRRSNGVVRIGYYDPADGDGPVHWLNENEIRYPGRFNYSCVTQLLDENNVPTDSFGLLYEKDATGGMEMLYFEMTSEDLLGEGWALVQEVPALPTIENEIVFDEEVAPAIAAAKTLDLDMGEAGALTAAVTLTGEGVDNGEEAVVTWTSSDPSVATVSAGSASQARLLSDEEVVTAPGEQVVINAVGAGRALITATTTKNGITRKAVTEVVVQGEDDIIVPAYYLGEMVTADAAGTTAYTVSADGLEKLIAAGGDAVEEDYTETLELAATYTNKAKADAAQAQIDEVTKALYAKLTGRDYEAELPEPPEADVYTVGSIADRVYTGEALEPTVVVRKNGVVLTMGYTLEYKNNVNVGEATVNVLVGGKVVVTGTFRIMEDTAGGDPDDDPGNTPSDTPSTPTRRPASVEEDLDDLDVPLAQLPMTFEDVKADDWFYEAAEFVFAQDIMQGVSATEFRPTMNTTRGMVVTILHRMAQEPEADPAAFADVASTAWYGPAVAWGAQSKVVQGADDGDFHPMDAVTREQLAAFLYRFAEYSGYDVSARGELSGYADSAVISSWAKDAMSWAVGTGLITGKDGNVLAPLSAANRAELATILTRFCKTVAEEK